MSTLQAAPVPPPPADSAAERIGQARGYHRWSQDELIARMAAIAPEEAPSRRTLSSWENGASSPRVDDLVLIARATSFPAAWFVMGLEAVAVEPYGPDGQGIRPTACNGDATILEFPGRFAIAA